ncbi:hypothetical protein F5880DRAFT_1619545, partial [Lentinula raphanica]
PAAASVYSNPAVASISPYGSFPVSSVVPDTSLYADPFPQQTLITSTPAAHVPAPISSSVFHAPKAVASLVPRKGRWSDFVEQELLISEGEEENIRIAHSADSVRRRSLSDSMSSGPFKRRRSEDSSSHTSSRSSCDTPSEPSPVAAVSQEPAKATTESVVHDQVSPEMPFFEPHLLWRAVLQGHDASKSCSQLLLIDDGCPFVLIDTDLVRSLGLRTFRLPSPRSMTLAMSDGNPQIFTASLYCKLSLRDPSDLWRSKTVRALILPSLCHPMILGLPFLSHNSLTIDYAKRAVLANDSSFDLLHPVPPVVLPPVPTAAQVRERLDHELEDTLLWKKFLMKELKDFVRKHPDRFTSEPVSPFNVVAAVKARIEQLEFKVKQDKC